LVDLGLENINYRINISLKEIGEYFNIDRSYIFMLNESGKLMSNQYEWAAPGISSQKEKLQDLKTKNYQWWFKNLRNKDVIIIEDVDRLEAEAAAEKKLLKAQNIKSLIVFPIYIEDKITGFFGFDLVENKIDINEIKIEQLKIFTDVITNALSKHQDNLKIKKLSYYDSLTDIYNRRFFEEELKRLDTARQLPISIIMADLNGLKIINDSYGHKTGDKFLLKTAEVLKNTFREEDIIARWGGDEFVILLNKTSRDTVEKLAKRIKNKKTSVDVGKDENMPLSLAVGYSVKTDEDESVYNLFINAEDMMYKDK
jgi:diguanylate cyclase (GGDEF)-like protein